MIKARQVHYTSCRHGISGQPGFQIRAMSDGVSQVEQNEIMKRSGYKRPKGDQEHPIAFRYYALSSGKYALTRAVYVGTDYSGREGNLFAHTLVFDEIDTWPSALFDWENWKSRLEEGEDEDKPAPLPMVELNLAHKPACEFIKTEEQKERLKTMLTALFLSQSSKRTLVLRGEPQQQTQWISCIHQCFPLSIAQKLEFSTYENEPSRLPMIAATVAGSAISLDATQRQYQFYVFDDISGQDSQLPEDGDNLFAGQNYAELVGLKLSHPQELATFFEFTQTFNCAALDALLGNVAKLYALAIGLFDVRGNELPPDELRDSVEFAIEDQRVFHEMEITDNLSQRVSSLAQEVNTVSDWSLYARFLAKAAVITKSPVRQADALAVWQKMLIASLRSRSLSSENLQKVRQDIEHFLPDTGGQLAESLLEPTTLQEVTTLLPSLCGDTAVRAIQVIAATLEEIGHIPPFTQTEILNLISAISVTDDCLRRTLPSILRQINNAKVFCAVCEHVYTLNAEHKKALGEIIAQLKLSPGLLDAIRQSLSVDLLLAELGGQLQLSQSQVDTFIEHRLNVLDQRDGLNWLYISRFVVYLLKQSNDAAALKLAYHLLERDELGELAAEEPALLRRCIELINADTKLQPDVSSHSKNLDKVLELSYQNQIQLRPNKIELQHLLNMMTGRMIDKIKTEQSMEVMRDHFIYLTEKEYEQFVQSILNAHVTTYGEKHVCIETDKHVILLRGLCKPDKFNENFKKIYIAWLDKTLPLLKDKSCLTDFIELWLTRNESYTEGRFMKSIAEKVTDLLAEALTLHSDRKLCMASLQTAVSKSKPAKERYKELISTAHKLKPSRWSKWNPRNWF